MSSFLFQQLVTDIGYLFWQVLGAATSICPPFPVSCTSLPQPHIFKCLARGSFPPRWWLLGVVVNHWWPLGTKVKLQVHSHHRLAKMLERSDATHYNLRLNSNSFKIYCTPLHRIFRKLFEIPHFVFFCDTLTKCSTTFQKKRSYTIIGLLYHTRIEYQNFIPIRIFP